jgi:YesN/AraC family two-component response regulator
MTASAIQGDREKCLDSGMNNYLAKPVRAQTLKALLDSYVNKEGEKSEIANLQAEAKRLVKQALDETGSGETENNSVKQGHIVDAETGEAKMRSRPASIRSVTQRWLGSNGKEAPSPELPSSPTS